MAASKGRGATVNTIHTSHRTITTSNKLVMETISRTTQDPNLNSRIVATMAIRSRDLVDTVRLITLQESQQRLMRIVEMSNMNGAGAPAGRGPDHILNECRNIDRAIDDIENELERLTGVQQRYLADTNTSRESPLGREVDRLSQNIMTSYRGLVNRVKTIKQDKESGNPRNAPQVGKVDRRLKTTINKSQQVERDFRRRAQEQIERQYRIVRPDASDAEVREAVEDTSNQQVFSQAVSCP